MRPEILRVLKIGKPVGKGVKGSPIRIVEQYWEMTEDDEFRFLVEFDPSTGEWHDTEWTPAEYLDRDGVERAPGRRS